jgi:hypothetical protein
MTFSTSQVFVKGDLNKTVSQFKPISAKNVIPKINPIESISKQTAEHLNNLEKAKYNKKYNRVCSYMSSKSLKESTFYHKDEVGGSDKITNCQVIKNTAAVVYTPRKVRGTFKRYCENGQVFYI